MSNVLFFIKFATWYSKDNTTEYLAWKIKDDHLAIISLVIWFWTLTGVHPNKTSISHAKFSNILYRKPIKDAIMQHYKKDTDTWINEVNKVSFDAFTEEGMIIWSESTNKSNFFAVTQRWKKTSRELKGYIEVDELYNCH